MTMGETRKSAMTRRARPLEVRQAAARMVIAANTANGKATDPRIIAVAEGRVNTRTADSLEVVFDDEDSLENDLRPVAAPSFRRLLGSSLLWAIPVS
ncbi:hypothetical protein [Gordonia rubripertincta]|uniref:Uncharacterized protein n=1 Tax=Gordonia rubripertincta TaxID=36822 RepID=A0ABT4MYW5_GORRU|nr:hypothetical protein [Gordonia rubripertincta]MCZ4552197.1 hypothetical protein [Gordonia rubripertincta]